jgi:hypothetical protein
VGRKLLALTATSAKTKISTINKGAMYCLKKVIKVIGFSEKGAGSISILTLQDKELKDKNALFTEKIFLKNKRKFSIFTEDRSLAQRYTEKGKDYITF